MAGKTVERTAIAEFNERGADGKPTGERIFPGERIKLDPVQLKWAIGAGVVYEDDDRDGSVDVLTKDQARRKAAGLPINDPEGKVADETSDADLAKAQTGAAAMKSGVAAQSGQRPRPRR